MDAVPVPFRFGPCASLQRHGKDAAVVFVFEHLISVIGMEEEHPSIVRLTHETHKWLERQVS
jgi:hypothetical protein